MKLLQSAKKSAIMLLLLLCNWAALFAQGKTVTGKVTSKEDGKPVEGVTVAVKGSSQRSLTNERGEFSITVPGAETILVFSYVGKTRQEIKVGGQTAINLAMVAESGSLDDVVITVGYGTKKRANVLGSVATIDPKEVEDLPVANLTTALVNKVPGVSINQTSGKPGSTTSLRIRNPVTFGNSGSIEPLYVIDGIAYNDPDGKTFFDNLDATMVESISFLKDAAASIYGSRGANGVVLVTTKKGKPGKPRISYAGSYGLSSPIKVPERLNSLEHITLLNNKYAARSGNAWLNSMYTQAELDYAANNNYNWLDEVFENSYLQRHTLNVSGGSDKITFFGGANYLKEIGNFQDLYATRYGVRMGMSAKITEDLTADVNFSLDNSVQNRPTPKGIAAFAGQNSDQNDQLNATIGALMLIPQWVPLYIDGKPLYTAAPGWHPKEVQNTGTYARSNSKGQNITVSLNYKVPFLKGLSFRANYGYNTRNAAGKEYYVSYNLYDFQRLGLPATMPVTRQAIQFTNIPTTSNAVRAIKNGNSLRQSTDDSKNYQLNFAANFKKKFGKHDIDFLALAEQSESSTNGYFTSVEGQVIPGIDEFWGFTTDKAFFDHASASSETGRMSYLGRVNYSYMDRYLFEGSLRADASPNFPKASRWGYFPSAAIGWRISQENFLKDVAFLDDLKIRYQIGATGSDAVRNYQYYDRFTQTTGMLFGTTSTPGLNNNAIPNPSITWEKALYNNVGLDGTILKKKFNFTLDFYTRHNTDMLQTATSTVPGSLGVAIADQNYAEMKSWGLEGSLNYNGRIGKDFNFNVQVNTGFSDNKVLKKFYAPASDTGWKNPIGRRTDNGVEGYVYTGIFRNQAEVDDWYKSHPGWKINGDSARVGYMNFQDINGDGVITELDKGRIAPRSGSVWGAGFNLGMSYKGLRLSINASLTVGGTGIYDKTARTPPTENQGALSFWRDSWSPTNPNAKYPVINAPLASEVSTFWMVNNTLLRVNNAQLSYSLPQAWAAKYKIPDVKMYIVATNLFDIINHQNYKSSWSNVAVDYPPLRTFTFGLNVAL